VSRHRRVHQWQPPRPNRIPGRPRLARPRQRKPAPEVNADGSVAGVVIGSNPPRIAANLTRRSRGSTFPTFVLGSQLPASDRRLETPGEARIEGLIPTSPHPLLSLSTLTGDRVRGGCTHVPVCGRRGRRFADGRRGLPIRMDLVKMSGGTLHIVLAYKRSATSTEGLPDRIYRWGRFGQRGGHDPR